MTSALSFPIPTEGVARVQWWRQLQEGLADDAGHTFEALVELYGQDLAAVAGDIAANSYADWIGRLALDAAQMGVDLVRLTSGIGS